MRLNDRIKVACAGMQVADTKAAILYARAHLRLKDLGPDALLLGRQSAVLMNQFPVNSSNQSKTDQ